MPMTSVDRDTLLNELVELAGGMSPLYSACKLHGTFPFYGYYLPLEEEDTIEAGAITTNVGGE